MKSWHKVEAFLTTWGNNPIIVKACLVLLFLAALFLRLNHLKSDPDGDEALYYFLSKHWLRDGGQIALQEFVRRPLLPILYHPFAYSLESFRLINIILGALIPILVYFLLREYRVNHWVAFLGGTIASLNGILVQFSAFVFQDMLGTFFALLTLIFLKKGKYKTSAIMLCLATLAKEYFVILGLALILIFFIKDRRITWRICAYILSLIPIAILGLVDLTILGARWGGWSVTNLNQLFLSLSCLPVCFLLLFFRRWEEMLLLLVYPLFYVFWRWLIGEGIDVWYNVFPITLSITFLCLVLDDISKHVSWTIGKLKAGNIFVVVIVGCVLSISIFSTIRFESAFHGDDARFIAEYIDREYNDPDLLVVDPPCWALIYYPFNEVAQAKDAYSHSASAEQIAERAKNSALLLVFKSTNSENQKLRQFDLGREVLETDRCVLVEVKGSAILK